MIMKNTEAVAVWKLTKDPYHRNRALKAILKNNSGIIHSHHKRVINRWANLDDYQQQAAIQAMDTLDRFDPVNYQFSTYFAHTCKDAVAKTNQTAEIINPKYRPKKHSIYNPDLPPTKNESKHEWKRKEYVSLTAPDHDGNAIQDVLSTTTQPDPSDAKKFTDALIDCLTAKEKDIVSHYFGLGKHPKTLEDISNIKHITRERVRQIVHKSLRKLRNRANQMKLSGNTLFKELGLNL